MNAPAIVPFAVEGMLPAKASPPRDRPAVTSAGLADANRKRTSPAPVPRRISQLPLVPSTFQDTSWLPLIDAR